MKQRGMETTTHRGLLHMSVHSGWLDKWRDCTAPRSNLFYIIEIISRVVGRVHVSKVSNRWFTSCTYRMLCGKERRNMSCGNMPIVSCVICNNNLFFFLEKWASTAYYYNDSLLHIALLSFKFPCYVKSKMNLCIKILIVTSWIL
jgi:hypothetical protein